ncbi:MAG: CPBP family intramembrane metalloprotease [Anaerolineaceae bacterium]|nr:CPBP family intramembrane metalloprotease [Anaerolineaceae bacterium]
MEVLYQLLLGSMLVLLALASGQGRNEQIVLRATQVVALALGLSCLVHYLQLDPTAMAGAWWTTALVLLLLCLFTGATVFSSGWRGWLELRLQAGDATFRSASPRHVTALVLMPVVVACTLVLSAESGNPGNPFDLDVVFMSMLLLLLFAFLGVGFPLRRTWQQACERLNLLVPARRVLLLAVGVGILLVSLVSVLWLLWVLVTWPMYAENGGSLVNPGLATAVLSAAMTALGEETMFRGLLQPVFGVALTSVCFALLHMRPGSEIAFLPILGVSLTLGWLRWRHGTVAAIVAHFCYNLTLGLTSAWYGAQV